MEKKIKIKLIKSPIGYRKKTKLTVEALGINKLQQTVVKNDSPMIRGMIKVVSHLVEVSEVKVENSAPL